PRPQRLPRDAQTAAVAGALHNGRAHLRAGVRRRRGTPRPARLRAAFDHAHALAAQLALLPAHGAADAAAHPEAGAADGTRGRPARPVLQRAQPEAQRLTEPARNCSVRSGHVLCSGADTSHPGRADSTAGAVGTAERRDRTTRRGDRANSPPSTAPSAFSTMSSTEETRPGTRRNWTSSMNPASSSPPAAIRAVLLNQLIRR